MIPVILTVLEIKINTSYNKFMKSAKGFSLIEVLIALSLLSLVVLGIVKVITTSVSNLSFSGSQGRATALAQKEIGKVIDERNSDPTAFFQTQPEPSFYESSIYCVKKTITEENSKLTTLIPTDSPRYLTSKMFLITIEVFWDWKSSDTVRCGNDADILNYKHNIKMDTYLTN